MRVYVEPCSQKDYLIIISYVLSNINVCVYHILYQNATYTQYWDNSIDKNAIILYLLFIKLYIWNTLETPVMYKSIPFQKLCKNWCWPSQEASKLCDWFDLTFSRDQFYLMLLLIDKPSCGGYLHRLSLPIDYYYWII